MCGLEHYTLCNFNFQHNAMVDSLQTYNEDLTNAMSAEPSTASSTLPDC